jgi:hypothetical protein
MIKINFSTFVQSLPYFFSPTVLARKPNLEKLSIYSIKFFHNFHLSKSSFTCHGIRVNGLARRLFVCTVYARIWILFLVSVILRLIHNLQANILWFLKRGLKNVPPIVYNPIKIMTLKMT